MAVRKATIQEQINAAIAQANPGDRTHVSIQAIAGPNPMLMSMLGIIGQSFLTYYFVTVTDQAVLIHKASRMSNRPQEIVHALPPAEAMRAVSDIRRGSLWSSFRLQLPNSAKPVKMNVHRIWRKEMDQLLGMLTGYQPSSTLA
ncbi:hypothetical protein OG204_13400 [Streptomyces sp. NBC_01387]|uniref:hypothetical protein n=1 Tax=unclassified Streptomyces TaxID=2593676 RepID=UPI00202427EC|nr:MULTISPECIES: hypothetical protein [unclassified Streptomyces]MCX4550766.1 hypothetical protein [Streptomyces sp. NBC_01500]WSC22200.1 hypothetical protein OIE60_22320 [Streptomyces sp. NBC_01766]WSV56047.1 hypothetical protein OG282_21410 [Streptomyces sp. NBC_01014]